MSMDELKYQFLTLQADLKFVEMYLDDGGVLPDPTIVLRQNSKSHLECLQLIRWLTELGFPPLEEEQASVKHQIAVISSKVSRFL